MSLSNLQIMGVSAASLIALTTYVLYLLNVVIPAGVFVTQYDIHDSKERYSFPFPLGVRDTASKDVPPPACSVNSWMWAVFILGVLSMGCFGKLVRADIATCAYVVVSCVAYALLRFSKDEFACAKGTQAYAVFDTIVSWAFGTTIMFVLVACAVVTAMMQNTSRRNTLWDVVN